MPDNTLHIRIKKEYAAALIADLIKVQAVEAVEEEEIVELTTRQKEALDKELAAIAANPAYLQKWDDAQSRFKKP
jgi:broad-specificity NMP kinase